MVREASERYDLIVSHRQLTAELQQINAELEQRVQQRTAELANANQCLENLNQLKDEFLAIVSHDLRTPLAGILGAVDLLKTEDFNDPANTSALVEMIGRSGRRMLALVNNLLDLARIEAGRTTLDLRSMCLPALLRECLEAIEPAALVKEITCRLECAADLPDITGDSAKLYQVFSNLISNAIKFTRSGGVVTIGCACADESTVQVRIQDTGQGIPADELPRLFAKFEQTRTQATRGERGTGLGLYIVKQLVTLHRGTVSVVSTLGVGSTFTVSLPTTPESAAPDALTVGEYGDDPS
jgi:signal transduction histidine kinase